MTAAFPTIRAAEESDLPEVMVMNNAAVPAVSAQNRSEVEWLFRHAAEFLIAEDHGYVAGFIIVLGPGLDYASENYRWFSQRYEQFVYIDRVVVGKRNRGRGIGQALYEAVAESASAQAAPVLLAEVNIEPRNDQSLDFHDAAGFVSVGEQDTQGGTKRVTLLEKPLP